MRFSLAIYALLPIDDLRKPARR